MTNPYQKHIVEKSSLILDPQGTLSYRDNILLFLPDSRVVQQPHLLIRRSNQLAQRHAHSTLAHLPNHPTTMSYYQDILGSGKTPLPRKANLHCHSHHWVVLVDLEGGLQPQQDLVESELMKPTIP